MNHCVILTEHDRTSGGVATQSARAWFRCRLVIRCARRGIRRDDPSNTGARSTIVARAVVLNRRVPLLCASPRERFFRLSSSAIYILIAGSYTPFALGALRGAFGYSLLVAVWAMAVAGIALKFRKGIATGWRAVVPYIAMGWIAILGIKPLFDNVGMRGMMWMLAGGLFYAGSALRSQSTPLRSAVWHLFVSAVHLPLLAVSVSGGRRSARLPGHACKRDLAKDRHCAETGTSEFTKQPSRAMKPRARSVRNLVSHRFEAQLEIARRTFPARLRQLRE